MQERGIDIRRLSPEAIDNIMSRYEERIEQQAARIKELQDLIDKPPEEADWVADYHLLQSALDGPIIDAARKWHAAYRKAQNSNLMRAKEVERLRSARKSGLYGKYIIQKADGSPVDPEADYFILRLDADPVARIAALEYAIQTDDQKLGEMLEKRVMDHVFSKDDQCRKRVEGWPIGQIKQLREQIAAKDARIKELEEMIRQLGSLAFMGDMPLDQIVAHFIAWGQSNYDYTSLLEAAFLESEAAMLFYRGTRYPVWPDIGAHAEVYRQKAREALAQIQTGGKDDL